MLELVLVGGMSAITYLVWSVYDLELVLGMLHVCLCFWLVEIAHLLNLLYCVVAYADVALGVL